MYLLTSDLNTSADVIGGQWTNPETGEADNIHANAGRTMTVPVL